MKEISFEHQSEESQKLKEVWRELFEREPIVFYRKVREFEQNLKRKFPDYLDYEMYHVLNGTSAHPSFPLKKQDFPGEFSVREFLLNAKNNFG
jgi:hypothetical protein